MQTYPTGHTESHRMAEQIFREILPRHGMAVREEQIALCHEVLDTLYNKEISLCEAGVGTGWFVFVSIWIFLEVASTKGIISSVS